MHVFLFFSFQGDENEGGSKQPGQLEGNKQTKKILRKRQI